MIETRNLKAGTVVKIEGFPVRLTSDVGAESANWSLIDEFEADQQAQRDIEARGTDFGDQVALTFADVSVEKDGGVSAEVVRTLKGA